MPPRSKFYAWGYGLPQSAVILKQFRETEEARQFAAERGWDETQPGAWAMEIALPMSIIVAMKALEPILGLDASVAGWGGRKISDD